jgi:hypothetical protein
MLGAILAGAVIGAATLIILKGRRGTDRAPVRVEARDRRGRRADRDGGRG